MIRYNRDLLNKHKITSEIKESYRSDIIEI